MGSVTYYVGRNGFRTQRGRDLVAMDPVSRARVLAVTKAGAVAFSRTRDPDIGEFADAVGAVQSR